MTINLKRGEGKGKFIKNENGDYIKNPYRYDEPYNSEDDDCEYCGGKMEWCDCCKMYSRYCCEEYGDCACC